MSYEQKIKDVDRIVSLCKRATSSKYSCPRGEAIEAVVEPVIGISLLVLLSIALIPVTKVAQSYGLPDGVVALLKFGFVVLFMTIYIIFQCRLLERAAGKTTALIQRIFYAQTPTWQKTISAEFQSYSPVDQIAYDALMALRDEAGCVTLEQVRSWHAKELQALKVLVLERHKADAQKICISQP